MSSPPTRKQTSPSHRTGLERLSRSGRARQSTNTNTIESRRNSLQRNILLQKEDSTDSNTSLSSTQLSIFGSTSRDSSRASRVEEDSLTRQTSVESLEQKEEQFKRRPSCRKRESDALDDNPSLSKQRRMSTDDRVDGKTEHQHEAQTNEKEEQQHIETVRNIALQKLEGKDDQDPRRDSSNPSYDSHQHLQKDAPMKESIASTQTSTPQAA
ncbi:hypothetical protein MBLNU457_1223t1 [Dothideomycetes sp. NU457]